ncbi:hypothetical protein X927_06420 [Petrotoga mexicana DSM 14811]|uniref:2'-5' RNA ligase n=1 Tax=Petrotoga mexicana DSM 14811 TaxID=1122954 RepID=A0A2K1P8Z4_9BACT|nr:2'-5' RNA ligase family protein [Petrotoga mexicana]PNR99254.1 hypothetical protein X927_06420 [Petrotoga mexicana DSM 14811]
MQSLLTILPQPFYNKITKLWNELDKNFDVKWVKNNVPFPHITWSVAEEYKVNELNKLLKKATKELDSLTIKTEGIALFTGPKLTLYIPVKPTKELLNFHEYLWNLVNVNESKLNDYYSPDNWFPHITLAVEDIDKENIGQITSYLSDKKLKYQIKLESLSLVHRELGKEVEIDQTFGIPKRRKRKK